MRNGLAVIVLAFSSSQVSFACAPTAKPAEIEKAAGLIAQSPGTKGLRAVLLKADRLGLFETRRLHDSTSPIAREIVRRWRHTVPALIELLEDTAPTKTPAICYWYQTSVGDLSLAILTELLTETNGKSVIPGLGWDELLERQDPDKTAETVLREFITKHGRRSLRSRFEEGWRQYSDRLELDEAHQQLRLKTGDVSGLPRSSEQESI